MAMYLHTIPSHWEQPSQQLIQLGRGQLQRSLHWWSTEDATKLEKRKLPDRYAPPWHCQLWTSSHHQRFFVDKWQDRTYGILPAKKLRTAQYRFFREAKPLLQETPSIEEFLSLNLRLWRWMVMEWVKPRQGYEAHCLQRNEQQDS